MKRLAVMLLSFGFAAAAFAADIEAGMSRSVVCQACHGPAGISASDDVPNLAGQKTAYLARQLQAFKSGERKHDIMNAIAGQLGDGDIANLAAFWNSVPTQPTTHELAGPAAAARSSHMQFPADFPLGFTAYRTDDDAKAKRVSRYYANRVALDAARADRPLPDGSVIVVAMSRAKLDGAGNPVIGPDRRFVAEAPRAFSAMEARAGADEGVPDLLRNGNWTYALFDAERVRNESTNYAMCLGCHKRVARTSYVFTLNDLRGTVEVSPTAGF